MRCDRFSTWVRTVFPA